MPLKHLMLILLMIVGLAACGGGDSDSTTDSARADEASAAVEAYLRAKVAGDRDGVADHICADMEDRIDAESLSFSGVTAEIHTMTCRHDPDGETVTCDGQIDADYGGEARTFELGTYRVVQEDGVWKWCGETAAPDA